MAAKQTETDTKETKQGSLAKGLAQVVNAQSIPLSMIKMNEAQNSRQTSGLDKESMAEFAKAIKENGLLNPITVRPVATGFDLIAGFRRCKAAKMLGWTTIPAIIKPEGTTDQEVRILNYAENVHRNDLSTFEKAHALVSIMETGVKQSELVERLQLNQAQSTVNNLIRIYKSLDPQIKDWWKDSNSKVGKWLTMANLLDIVSYPVTVEKEGQKSQKQRLLELQNLVNPQSIAAQAVSAAIGAGEGGEDPEKKKKAVSTICRVKRKDIEAIMSTLEEVDYVDERSMGAYMSAFDFVLGRHGGKLMYGDKVLWSAEKQKAAEKEAKKKEKAGRKTGKKE